MLRIRDTGVKGLPPDRWCHGHVTITVTQHILVAVSRRLPQPHKAMSCWYFLPQSYIRGRPATSAWFIPFSRSDLSTLNIQVWWNSKAEWWVCLEYQISLSLKTYIWRKEILFQIFFWNMQTAIPSHDWKWKTTPHWEKYLLHICRLWYTSLWTGNTWKKKWNS